MGPPHLRIGLVGHVVVSGDFDEILFDEDLGRSLDAEFVHQFRRHGADGVLPARKRVGLAVLEP